MVNGLNPGVKGNFNPDLIKRNIYRPTKADSTEVTIPYIKGTSDTISRILHPYNVRAAHKLQLR